jgi:hypothetical protein
MFAKTGGSLFSFAEVDDFFLKAIRAFVPTVVHRRFVPVAFVNT